MSTAFSLGLYWQALDGPFMSDDMVYIVLNPWTEVLSLDRVVGIFDPTGEARFSVVNYAPLTLLATALERAAFWDDPRGYHVVNLLLHALNASLLSALLVRAGLAFTPALLGALFFLLHPGNVEVVAWISQLKTLGALAFALGALLALDRHPGWATLLFLAGLLTEASAAMALPMAAALLWCREEGAGTRAAWLWLGGWLLLFLLYSVPKTTAIHPRGTVEVSAYEDAWVHLRTIASVGVTTSLPLRQGSGSRTRRSTRRCFRCSTPGGWSQSRSRHSSSGGSSLRYAAGTWRAPTGSAPRPPSRPSRNSCPSAIPSPIATSTSCFRG